MKRTLSVMALALAMVALVGCGKKETPAASVTVPEVKAAAADAVDAAAPKVDAAKEAVKEVPKDHPAH